MTSPIQSPLLAALQLLGGGHSLSRAQAREAFDMLMRGEATPAQTAALLMGLRAKGETGDEIAGAVEALRGSMRRVEHAKPEDLVDTCGTGGGTVTTLNISTAAAFVVAAAGVPVAKHGNRSFTSRSGSADVIEAMGLEMTVEPEAATHRLREDGFVFLFAPHYHPAMRHVAPVRREIGIPTAMNIVGPLANPAGVRRQVIGVADVGRAQLVAAAVNALGAIHALVACAAVGMDEISPAGRTHLWEIRDGSVRSWELDPASVGLAHGDLTELAGGTPEDNAARIAELLGGRGAPAVRAAVALNAGAALYVAGGRASFRAAVDEAVAMLDSGKGLELVERLRDASRESRVAGGESPSR